jgi:hypothetical protein
MFNKEIIAVCSEIHTNHINTACGQNLWTLKNWWYVNKTITFKRVSLFTIPNHIPLLITSSSLKTILQNTSQRFLECQCLVSPLWDHTSLKVKPSSEVSSVSFRQFPQGLLRVSTLIVEHSCKCSTGTWRYRDSIRLAFSLSKKFFLRTLILTHLISHNN